MNRSFIKKYRSEYELKVIIDPKTGKENKSVVYKGPRFAPANEARELKTCKIKAALCCAACIIMYGCAGFLDTSGGRSFLTMLPFASAVLPLGFLCVSVINIFANKPPLTRMENDKSYGRVGRCAIALAILSGLAALGSCVLIAMGSVKIAQDTVFTVLCISITILAIAARISLKKVKFDIIT